MNVFIRMKQNVMKNTIHRCGDKLVIDLPEDLSVKLGWGVGDILDYEIVDGGVKITRTMTTDDHVMQVARQGMDEYADALKALAKS